MGISRKCVCLVFAVVGVYVVVAAAAAEAW